jgi:hypothetical protein
MLEEQVASAESAALPEPLRASSSSLLSWLSIFQHQFIEIYQFNDTHFSIITKTKPVLMILVYPPGRVPTFSITSPKRALMASLLFKVRESNTSVMCRIFFSSGNQRLNKLLQFFCLGKRSRNTLVKNQGSCHVGKHCLPVRGSPSKVVKFLTVSHFILFFIKFVLRNIHPEGQTFFLDQLLKFSKDFLPKFLNFIISEISSLARSPRVLTSAAFKQLNARTERSSRSKTSSIAFSCEGILHRLALVQQHL